MRFNGIEIFLFRRTKNHSVKLRSFSYQGLDPITFQVVNKGGKTHDNNLNGNERNDY